MPRAVLIVPSATYRAPDFIAAARRLGVEVVVASEHRQALSRAMGDRALVVSLRDGDRAAEAIAELSKRAPVDAVLAVDDQGTLAAALACERLGLRGNPPAAVAAARDKRRMREALAVAGVRQPSHAVAPPDGDAAAIAAGVGLPCVVKPLSMSASRGVIRADSPAGAAAAAARVRAIAGADATLLVEAFVPGAEVAVEGLLRAGRLELLAVFDKPDPLDGPYFEETIYVTPSRQPPATLAAVEAAVKAACGALGLVEGPVHAEARIDRGTVTILELAARSIGGLCSRTLRFGLGLSLEELILRQALGLPLDELRRMPAAAGVMMLPIPRAGTLLEVGGAERARAVEGIRGLELTIAPGGRVEPLPEGDRYLGFVFADGPSPALVERSLRAAHELLDIRIEAPLAA